MRILPQVLILATTLLTHPVHAQETAMDRTPLLTGRSFDVRILANGRDVTAASPIARVKYHADGTGTRTLRDGTQVTGRWRFLNPQQTQIEVQGPEGTSRWVILELREDLYRKANLDTGIELVHVPGTP